MADESEKNRLATLGLAVAAHAALFFGLRFAALLLLGWLGPLLGWD